MSSLHVSLPLICNGNQDNDFDELSLREKCPNTYFPGPYFPVFGLNTEI